MGTSFFEHWDKCEQTPNLSFCTLANINFSLVSLKEELVALQNFLPSLQKAEQLAKEHYLSAYEKISAFIFSNGANTAVKCELRNNILQAYPLWLSTIKSLNHVQQEIFVVRAQVDILETFQNMTIMMHGNLPLQIDDDQKSQPTSCII
jgi:hypothetical protein